MTPSNKLTQMVLEYLKWKGHYAWRSNNLATAGRRHNVHAGVPDITGCHKDGRYIGVEIKIGADKQSAAQVKFQQEIKCRGGIYLVAKTIDDVLMDKRL